MKEKIAVITWLGKGNYGTTLQAYALKQFIKKMGYEVVFPFTFNVTILYKIKKIIMRLITFLKTGKTTDKQKRRETGVKYDKLREHLQTYNTLYITNKKEYRSLLNTIDVYITGSDQIWNTYHSYDPFYFLNFAKDKKRIAYASSIGTNNVPIKYQKKIRNHLMKFQYIGVREESAVKVLSELTKRKDIIQVPDPTFLLTKDDWNDLTQKAKIEISVPEKYMLCYLIGNNEEYSEQLKNTMKQWDIDQVVVIPAEEHPEFPLPANALVYGDAGPAEFVHLIQHATLVCTDSFHATALSINLGIDFVEFIRFHNNDNKSQNSRINDLLKHYHLSNREYSEESDSWTRPIFYEQIINTLEKDREKALRYLIKAIKD